jgi:hypothetical protein
VYKQVSSHSITYTLDLANKLSGLRLASMSVQDARQGRDIWTLRKSYTILHFGAVCILAYALAQAFWLQTCMQHELFGHDITLAFSGLYLSLCTVDLDTKNVEYITANTSASVIIYMQLPVHQ